MKTIVARTGWLIAFLAVASSPLHAQVYKCGTGGQATYQDHPCAGAPNAAPHIAADPMLAPIDPDTTAAQLRQMVKDDTQKIRELSTGRADADVALAQRSTGTARQDWSREHATLDASWQNRIKVVQDHLHRVTDELQRRCGKGAISPGCR